MHRREFITAVAGTLGGISAIRAAADSGSSTKPIPIGLNTYCLRAMKWHDVELIDYTAGLKLDAIFLQDSVDPGLMDPAHWAKVREYARDKGLERLETGGGAILPKTPEGFDASVKALEQNIVRAKGLGSPIVRCLLAGERANGGEDPARGTVASNGCRSEGRD
jgi:hypothetical protein